MDVSNIGIARRKKGVKYEPIWVSDVGSNLTVSVASSTPRNNAPASPI
jgi:hypothetical protein